MRRPRHRNEVAGSTYHVMARGVDRRRIFVDDEDFERYKRLLGYVVERTGWRVLCFCLMPNHVHLLIETPQTNLGSGMQILHGRYARTFNERHDRVGHLFENRFASPLITSEGDLIRTVRYIVMNPVAAKLCDEPERWQWGSHEAVAARRAPRWVAHRHLVNRLRGIIGAADYATLVAYGRTVKPEPARRPRRPRARHPRRASG